MPASTDEQFSFLKTRMKDYFARLAWVSEQWTPPGKNAANGNWPVNTINDAPLKNTEGQTAIQFDGDGEKLLQILSQFQDGIRQALSTPNASANAWKNLPLFWDVFKDGISTVIDVVTDVYNLFSDDKEKQKQAKEKLFSDIEALIKKIEDNGMVENGEHANGTISLAVRDRSNEAIAALDRDFPTGSTSQFQKLADALRVVCKKLSALKTEDHDPWLRPEWQVSFQATTKGASEGLAA